MPEHCSLISSNKNLIGGGEKLAAGDITVLYLITAATFGMLFAVVLSIRRIMTIETKTDRTLSSLERIEKKVLELEEYEVNVMKRKAKR